MSKVIVSGMRPTGPLHVGHYLGVLENWVRLQSAYTAYFFVADWHALSTKYENTDDLDRYSVEMVRQWIAAGIDPTTSVIFRQSDVLEHAELHVLLSMITPLPWLERVPSYKDMRAQLQVDLQTYGFLGYPLLQAADILMYKANAVPVGEDQIPHLEMTREVVRRFHSTFDAEIFPEPEALLSEAPRLPGTDGRKMSKSFDNVLNIEDTAEVTFQKIRTMVTDPQRVRLADPGDPDVCPVFDYHKVVSSAEIQAEMRQGCTSAAFGCVVCKKQMAEALNDKLADVRKRYNACSEADARDYLNAGAIKARSVAQQTMAEVRRAVGLQRHS